MPPVHENRGDGAVNCVATNLLEGLTKKGSKFGLAQFAGGHSELAMANAAQSADVAVNFDVIGRVRDGVGGTLATQQTLVRVLVSRVLTDQDVLPEPPTIARLRNTLTLVIGGAD